VIRAKLAKEIREKLKKKRYEELEGKDLEVESKRSVKLSVQGEKDEEKLEEKRSGGTSAAARKNPYARNIQKKGDEDRKASGSCIGDHA
jgi:hypothetical protein